MARKKNTTDKTGSDPKKSVEEVDSTDQATPVEETRPETSVSVETGDGASADRVAPVSSEDIEDVEATPDSVSEPSVDGAENGAVIETTAESDVAADSTEDPTETQADEDTSAPVSAPLPPVIEKRGPGFVPLVLGGLVAGAIGYAIPTFLMPADEAVPTAVEERINALEAQLADLPDASASIDFSSFEAAQAEMTSEIAALSERVAALETSREAPVVQAQEQAAPASIAAVDSSALDAVRADLTALSAQVAALPIPDASLADRVTALEAGLSALEAEAAAVETTAEDLAREAARNQVVLAMDSGLPFVEPLAVLGGDVPEALSTVAETGVPTAAALASDFPALAREALAVARRSEPVDGNPITAFLRRQTGARSLEPREGNDADAVLSRAEAAVRTGDVGTALAEVDKLPEDAKSVLDGWLAQARSRVAAQDALQDFLQTE